MSKRSPKPSDDDELDDDLDDLGDDDDLDLDPSLFGDEDDEFEDGPGLDEDGAPQAPRVRRSEQLLIDTLDDFREAPLLCNTAGRAQFATAFGARFPSASASCWLLDQYQQQQAQDCVPPALTNVQIACESDPPAGPYAQVAVCCTKRGDAELTRETLQLFHQRLELRGRMVATIDRPDDQWLHTEMQKLFKKVTRRPQASGVVYLATKSAELPKQKSYLADFPARDSGRLLKVRTRPGVFSHRKIDGGARALLLAAEVAPGQAILDIGCGSGFVGVAAALRAGGTRVLAIDSNPRAIDCARYCAAENGVADYMATLDCDGSTVPSAEFDLVLANPPYFSGYRIAALFLETALRALKPGGRVLVVTKSPDWFVEFMQDAFPDVDAAPVKDYFIVSGTLPGAKPPRGGRRRGPR